MKEFIQQIFTSIAGEAMDRGQPVTLKYENDQGESKTIISSSKRDEDVLTLSIWPTSENEGDHEEGPCETDEETDEEEGA